MWQTFALTNPTTGEVVFVGSMYDRQRYIAAHKGRSFNVYQILSGQGSETQANLAVKFLFFIP